MMISNRLDNLASASQPPVDTRPFTAGIAQSQVDQLNNRTGGVNYASASSATSLDLNYHPESARNTNRLLMGPQNNPQQGNELPATLSKLAELVRDILQRLLSLLQQGSAGQSAAGSPSTPIGTGCQPCAIAPSSNTTQPSYQQKGEGARHSDLLALSTPATIPGRQEYNEGGMPIQGLHTVETSSKSSENRGVKGGNAQPVAQSPSTDDRQRATVLSRQPSVSGATANQPQPVTAKSVTQHQPVTAKTDALPKVSDLPTEPFDKSGNKSKSEGENLRGSNQPVSTSGSTSATSRYQWLNQISGFAKAANTTGGEGGKVVSVSNVDQLQNALTGDTPTTIKLSQDISADAKVVLKFGANKTVESAKGAAGLHNVYLASDKTASNDIFRNLNFTHDKRYNANGDIPLFISNGQGYWIDHNTFSGNKSEQAKGMDKLLYVGGTADNVTLSNSVFKDNEYGVILGQPDDTEASAQKYGGYPRMTIANNVFDNLDVRAPGLMREGKFDVYNNLINNFNLGFTLAKNATVNSQSNYFENGYDMSNKLSSSGALNDYGNAKGFHDSGSNVSFAQKSQTTSWQPDEYNRTVTSAEQAKTYDLMHAGAGKD